jgi:hypothetical protein
MTRKLRPFLFMITALFVLEGCTASTEITRSWRNPDYTATPLKSLLVVAISNDAIARGNVEGAIVRELKASDVPARMGIELFPPLLFKEPISKDVAKEKIRESGADAVLLITLISSEEKETYIPGAMVYTPAAGSVYMYGFWYDSWNMSYSQGAYLKEKFVVLQSNLYRTADEALLWEARSQATDPQSLEKASRIYAGVLVSTMFSDGALVKGGPR